MQLHLERLKFGLRQLRFKLRSSKLAFSKSRVIIDRVAYHHDQPVDQHVIIEEGVHRCDQARTREVSFRFGREQKGVDYAESRHRDDREQQAYSYVNERVAKQAPALYWKAAREIEQQRREQCPQVSERQFDEEKHFLPVGVMTRANLANIVLAVHKQANQRPRAKDDRPL